VANSALAVIRRKVQPEDFGTFEEFGLFSPRKTLEGDWSWCRPGFYLAPATLPGGANVFQGDISIFAPVLSNGYTGTNSEIPYNSFNPDHASGPPEIIIRQTERYYPQVSVNTTNSLPPRPAYVWDCMFRRFQGKILVAIFVYRVGRPGGGGTVYAVAPNASNPTVAPLPIWLSLTSNPDYSCDLDWDNYGPDENKTTFYDNHVVRGTAGGVQWDLNQDPQGWQAPRQWILDQNNSIHRVLSSFREADSDPVYVELVKPVSPPPLTWMDLDPLWHGYKYTSPFYLTDAFNFPDKCVSDIWYIPLTNSEGLALTPIYLTVKEL
jgi:hypothetical protein